MIELCITGIPGTGKSSVCDELNRMGYRCLHLNDLASDLGCLEGDSVDTDCLRERMTGNYQMAESHYSHFLDCRKIVILECEISVIEERLKKRGYPPVKIQENIEVQMSDLIYLEALEKMPSTRIARIDCSAISVIDAAAKIAGMLEPLH